MKSATSGDQINQDAGDSTGVIYGGILNLKPVQIIEYSGSRLTQSPQEKRAPAATPTHQDQEKDRADQIGKDAGGQLPQISDRQGRQNPDAFQWESALRQSMLFLAIAHSFRMATEPGTRDELKGPFFKDYFRSVKNLRGWKDGDPAFVNYIGHPMEGSVAGYIQIHNDPKYLKSEFDPKDKAYWKSRMKAMAWAAAWSTQFELGPLSEASLGNVGLKPTRYSEHPMAYVDLVITPALGAVWMVGEDMIDRYFVRYLESKTSNRVVIILARSFLNPTRAFANMHRGKWFWYRDNRR